MYLNMMILCVGPIYPPIHGQSLAFTRFYESIDKGSRLLINTNMKDAGKLYRIFVTIKTFLILILTILSNKIDVAYFTCSRSILGSIKDVILINFASFKKIKIINHLHGSDFYDFLHSSPDWYKRILFHAYSKVDTSIVLLESMKEQFKDFKEMKLEVVTNFYDKELDRKVEEKEKEKLNILYLSNIIKSKGILELINAFDELSKKHEHIHLNIAGNFLGDSYLSKNEIEDMFLKQISQSKKINYLGAVYGVKKIKLLQRSDIFVLPSYYKSEAFPISVIEAMACGNAIITTKYKYLPEVIKSENGILIDTHSPDAIKDALSELIDDNLKLRTMQSHNINEARENYSVDQYIKKLKKIVLKSP